ncbi:MAG: carboxypeptidase-like regulatory domain-containing protein [Flavobacteriales bacterium]|nr:carboxypeptidase-like regulatory domain-containing protein [Flavobacteriales bacterium]
MNKTRLSFILFLTTTVAIVQAQNATLQGNITDYKTKQSLPGAAIVIPGTAIGTSCDFDGNFTLKNIPSGKQNILVSFIGYNTDTLKLNFTSGETKKVNIQLKESMINMNEFVITETKVTHTETAVMMEMKQAEQVVSGVSSEQILKTQDRTASDVIRRIPGVTIMNNKFVMVRGLSERYNSVLLNGGLTPSLESDRKAFSFDILPSGVLDRILIYKTGAPELPGEFAGGVIKVFTKGIPDSTIFNLGYSTSYRAQTTFNEAYTSEKSNTDFLGFDNGLRALPDGFSRRNLSKIDDPKLIEKYGKMLPNNWKVVETTALPDQRLNLMYGTQFKKEKYSIGTITAINYTLANEFYEANTMGYNTYDTIAKRSDTIFSYNDKNYINSVRIGVMHNWTALINAKHKIEFRNLFNQVGQNQTTMRFGKNLEEGFQVQNYAYRYQQRTIYNGQFAGTHELNNDQTKIQWLAGFSTALSQEPDFRRIRTVRNIETTEDNVPFQVVIAPAASSLDAGRFYSNLSENVITASVDIEHAIKVKSEDLLPKIRTGFYFEDKARMFNARWMSYGRSRGSQFNQDLILLPLDEIFSSKNINDSTGFKIQEGTNPTDSYNAFNTLLAGYVGASIPFTPKLNFTFGARAEHNTQELSSKSYSNKPVIVNNPVLSILPSANIGYNLTEKSMLRLAYFQSVNRPEFRELAPFAYYDFNFNNVLYGNDSLLIATIHNADFRWEFYPTPSEIISVGAFYKYFLNPIEMFFVPGSGSGGTRNFTFDNAAFAKSIGAEVEIRKSMQEVFTQKFLQDFSLLINASYIISEVELGSKAIGQQNNRPMMGQSPYIINTGIYYDNKESQLQINALYNVIGKRIFAVGTFGTPDIYEMPRNVVDLNISKGIGKHFSVKISIQDILNNRVWLLQDSNENGLLDNRDETVMEFKRGTYFTLGVNAKF